jgi:hypothetical protein
VICFRRIITAIYIVRMHMYHGILLYMIPMIRGDTYGFLTWFTTRIYVTNVDAMQKRSTRIRIIKTARSRRPGWCLWTKGKSAREAEAVTGTATLHRRAIRELAASCCLLLSYTTSRSIRTYAVHTQVL